MRIVGDGVGKSMRKSMRKRMTKHLGQGHGQGEGEWKRMGDPGLDKGCEYRMGPKKRIIQQDHRTGPRVEPRKRPRDQE